jgi:Uma2 family endonuclease
MAHSAVRVALDDDEIRVPEWVCDLDSFRRWSDDDSFPEVGKISFLKGEVWIDMSKEQLFSHNQIKSVFVHVLMGLALADRKGRYFGDGAFVSNVEADVLNQPDGCFISTDALREKRVRIVEGVKHGYVELEGAPDMVLEVVSDSSFEKDTVVLREAYAAGVREYWLVDARRGNLRFDLLRLSKQRYVSTRKRAGWVWSDVFGRWFRLSQREGDDGFPEYALDVAAEQPAR